MTPKNIAKLVFDHGTNDADYAVYQTVAGKQTVCPFYRSWTNMMNRCYSLNYQAEKPTYIGCCVGKEWLTFSKFRAWMKMQDWRGKHLDKDILIPGNKIYGPEFCTFVTREINSLLNDHAGDRGGHPIGVHFVKRTGKFVARISKHGKRHMLGSFTKSEDARDKYIAAKVSHIIDVAQAQPPNIKAGLLRHAAIIGS